MSQWANENPERMAEISALPPSQQNAELRHAIGYDPDYVWDRLKEEQMDEPALPSEHFIRCEPEEGGCGASFRKDLDACPICAEPCPEDAPNA